MAVNVLILIMYVQHVSLKLRVARYICRISILTKSGFAIDNVLYVFSIDISTNSVAHYKKTDAFFWFKQGLRNHSFLWKTKLSYNPQRTVRRTMLITPYLVVDFNTACHLHLVPTTHLPQSNTDIHSQHVLLGNTLNIYKF